MTEFDDGGGRPTGYLTDMRNSFYEDNKHRIIAGINPEYRRYRQLVKMVEKAARPIGSGFFERILNSL